ncbi:MAG TPA: TetR/AcrR family transcriptional regulator [Planktothrix sp.]|jgi:AcrR family transcriptional regulator
MADSRKRGRPKQDPTVFEERNEEILDAATKMFAANGFAQTDIDELAGRLGIGKGTIYRAFTSKQELFFAALNRGLQRMSTFIQQSADPGGESVGRIALGVRAFLRFFDENPALIELFMQERAVFPDRPHSTYFEHRRTNAARWTAFFSDLMQKGFVRKMPADWLVETLNQLLYGQLFLHRYGSSSQSLESRCDDILTVFFTGILTSKGVEVTAFGARD